VKNTLKKVILAVLVLAGVYVIFLAFLFESRAGEELRQATASRERGDFAAANRHYFQALNWYAPWGASQRAADDLMGLAMEHFNRGQKTEAYNSLLRLRSGLLAARSFYVPRRDLLEKANALIALYLAEYKLGPEASPQEIMSQALVYAKVYSLETLPKQSWYFFVLVGFFTWVCASFWLITIFFGNKRAILLKMRVKLARVPIFIFIYGYALWIFSMSVA
jgi:tetratricopeptide (TPR) repeat protein